MPAKRRPHWRKLEWVSGSRLNAPGITIHAHNRKSTIKNTRPSTVIILPNGNSLASSDGSGMDPFHRERDIISRIINNAPYASHKRWQAEPLWKSPPSHGAESWRTRSCHWRQGFWNLHQCLTALTALAKLCNNLYKNTMFQEILLSGQAEDTF